MVFYMRHELSFLPDDVLLPRPEKTFLSITISIITRELLSPIKLFDHLLFEFFCIGSIVLVPLELECTRSELFDSISMKNMLSL